MLRIDLALNVQIHDVISPFAVPDKPENFVFNSDVIKAHSAFVHFFWSAQPYSINYSVLHSV